MIERSRDAASAHSASARACSSTTPIWQKTGLLGFGSRARYRRAVEDRRTRRRSARRGLRQDFTSEPVRVRSYKATEDEIGEDFTRAEDYLSLVGFVILILGGIGVSSVTRVFVQQKMGSIAILKCVGGHRARC